MVRVLIVAAAVLASGCAAKVISASERSVVVRAGTAMVGEAQKTADAECGKNGRKARLAGTLQANQFVFDCVN
jgi:uncharacterized protein YceK